MKKAFILLLTLLTTASMAGPVRIVYTNDTLGHIDDCGTCSGKAIGGFPRRITAVNNLRAEKIPMILVDSGNYTDDKEQIDIIAKTMNYMGYDICGTGERDVPNMTELKAAFGATKIKFLTDLTPEFRKVEGMKLGFISLGSVVLKEYDKDPALQAKVKKAFDSTARKSDMVVVLDQTNIVTEKFIEGIKTPTLIISGLSKCMYLKPKKIGSATIVPTYIRANQLGVAEIDPATREITWSHIVINDTVDAAEMPTF